MREKVEQTRIRFPGLMKERLQREAALAGRSMNQEVVVRMERSFRATDRRRAKAGQQKAA